MPTLTINGTQVTVDEGTTILHAANSIGVQIPHFCYHPALSRPANCRMCLVEVKKANKPLPACYNFCTEGMVVETESDLTHRARKSVLEFILLNHPIDCPICDQAGECKLQDYYFAHSAQSSRLGELEKVHKVKAFPLGPEVVYDGERCILCTRCVRFCEEVTQTRDLTVIERNDLCEIRTFPGQELDNDYSLCTVDMCPVGALTDRNFRFKCRVWFMGSTPSICTGCAKGCNIYVDHFQGEVQRYRPRTNPAVNAFWLCDHGRRTRLRLHRDRLSAPSAGAHGACTSVIAITETVRRLRAFLKNNKGEQLAFIVSAESRNEDLLSVFDLAQRLGVQRCYLAAHPDDAFTLRRHPERHSDGILIQADKNPNRRGAETLAAAAGIALRPLSDLPNDFAAGDVRALWCFTEALPAAPELQQALVKAVKNHLVIYQAPYQSWLSAVANIALPTPSHVEMAGSFVNGDGLCQGFAQAFPAPKPVLPHRAWIAAIAQRLRVRLDHPDDAALAAEIARQLQQAPPTPASGG